MVLQMDSITVTERAAQRIGEILRREPAGTMLRVSVEGGGCSGFQYKFDMDSAQAADDLVIQRDARDRADRSNLGGLSGRLRDRFRRRSDRRVVPDQQSAGDGILRLWDQLLDLTPGPTAAPAARLGPDQQR